MGFTENIDRNRIPFDAFEDAIKVGVLSEHRQFTNYAGDYMYMWSEVENGVRTDYFKNIDTREYLNAKHILEDVDSINSDGEIAANTQ